MKNVHVYLFVLFLCVIVLLLTSCRATKAIQEAQKPVNNNMFEEVDKGSSYIIVVDKETKVMYWVSDGSYNRGALTLLVNVDGTPRIWEGEIND